jgi:hypothetical protein
MADTEASVFNISNITITADIAQAFAEDAKVPIKDGVGKGDIRSPGFLTGITAGFDDYINDGIDQTIIKGDRVMEIKGNQYEKIHSNRSAHIIGREELKVDDVRTTEVYADDWLTVQRDHYLMVRGDVDITITGALFQTVFGPRHNNEVSDWFEWKGANLAELAIATVSLIMIGKADIYPMSFELGLLKREWILNADKKEVINNNQAIIQLHQRILVPSMGVFVTRIGGLYFHGLLPPFHPAI